MGTAASFQAILFDLDGTLLDSQPVYTRVLRLTFQEVLGRDITTEDTIRHMILPTGDFMDLYARGPQRARLEETFRVHLERIFPEARLFTGFEEILATLKKAGQRLAVVTSQNRVELAISRRVLNIDEWIDAWVCVDDAPLPKPDPQPVLVALANLITDPERGLMIGDSPVDIQSGRSAGLKVAAACWGQQHFDGLLELEPDYIFRHPLEILGLIYPEMV